MVEEYPIPAPPEAAEAESYLIPEEDWNALIAFLTRNLPARFTVRHTNRQRHPWHTTGHWSPEAERWEADVFPGFVNGLPVETEEGELSDSPRLPLSGWRRVVSGAPDHFRARFELASESGLVVTNSGAAEELETEPETRARQLWALDFGLVIKRPRTVIETRADGSVMVQQLGTSEPRARLVIQPTFGAAEPISPARLLAGDSDAGEDRLKVATLYAISQPGEEADTLPNDRFRLIAKHDQFYNLNHAVKLLDLPAGGLDLGGLTGLGLGLGFGQRLIDRLIDDLEAAQSVTASVLEARRVEGRFWSI